MADPIGFYNSNYTGKEIDDAVEQIKNKTNAPTGSTIMQRDANGRAQVEDGTSGKEIVNFKQLQEAIKSTYRHTISIRKNDDVDLIEGHVYLTIYSTNKLRITTLTDLKTVLGNTFIHAAVGYMNNMTADTVITHITQEGIFGWSNSGALYNTTYNGCEFFDTVTPIEYK